MLLFKGRAIEAKKNCKKNPYGFERLHFTLLGVQNSTRLSGKNGEHNQFSTFTDFLIIVQFWFLTCDSIQELWEAYV